MIDAGRPRRLVDQGTGTGRTSWVSVPAFILSHGAGNRGIINARP